MLINTTELTIRDYVNYDTTRNVKNLYKKWWCYLIPPFFFRDSIVSVEREVDKELSNTDDYSAKEKRTGVLIAQSAKITTLDLCLKGLYVVMGLGIESKLLNSDISDNDKCHEQLKTIQEVIKKVTFGAIEVNNIDDVDKLETHIKFLIEKQEENLSKHKKPDTNQSEEEEEGFTFFDVVDWVFTVKKTPIDWTMTMDCFFRTLKTTKQKVQHENEEINKLKNKI